MLIDASDVLGLPAGDLRAIVMTAASWAGVVGLAGLVLLWVARRRSVALLTLLVALVSVATLFAGVLGAARAMFLSDQDFQVIVVVSCVGAVVSALVAVAAGLGVRTQTRALRKEAREFGTTGRFTARSGGPADLREISHELERSSQRLESAREEAVRLEGSRRELVSWVSHDLRTPLAGLRAMTEALEDGMVDDPDRYHRQIRVEVDRMVRMVDDLFELSRIHAGVLTIDPQRITVGDVVSESLASAEPVARARGVHLEGSVAPGLEATADPSGVSRVLANLVHNAVRHTPERGVVSITGAATDDGVRLMVTDQCGGLSTMERERAFDVAWRGSSARTVDDANDASGSGAGLGLAIAQGIVSAHGGALRVANTDPGAGPAGCCFVMELPDPAHLT